jgi:hypothetical protein
VGKKTLQRLCKDFAKTLERFRKTSERLYKDFLHRLAEDITQDLQIIYKDFTNKSE